MRPLNIIKKASMLPPPYYIRPPYIPVASSVHNINNDRFLTNSEKDNTIRMMYGGASVSRNPLSGMVTTGDLVRGAVGAGIGHYAAKYLGTVVGATMGGLKPSTMNKIQNTGAFAGMLRGVGIWK